MKDTTIIAPHNVRAQGSLAELLKEQPAPNNDNSKEFWLTEREMPVPYRASGPLRADHRQPEESVHGGAVQNGAFTGREEPVGVLLEDIDTLVAGQNGSPPTETVPLYECPSNYRATPDGDGTTFQVYDSGRWWTQNCQTGLVWDQTLCRCEYPPGTRWQLDCRDFRSVPEGNSPGSFQQFVNDAWVTRDCSPSAAGLVWDQDICRCVWGPQGPEGAVASSPCDIMLNMTFDRGVQDEAKHSFVEVGQGLPLPTRNDPDRGPSHGGNRAAYFTDTALNIWYFSDNELGSSLRIEFRYYQDYSARNDGARTGRDGMRSVGGGSSVYQMFLSNGCNLTTPGYTAPSVAIGFRPSDQSYLLAFETIGNRKAIVCNRPSNPGRWHRVSLVYEDGTLVMRVDGQPCIISTDFFGPIQKTPCPLTIGADPLDRQSVYRGYLDDLLLARNCRDAAQRRPEDGESSDSVTVSRQPVAFRARMDAIGVREEQQSCRDYRNLPIKPDTAKGPVYPTEDNPGDINFKRHEENAGHLERIEEYVAPYRDHFIKKYINTNQVKKLQIKADNTSNPALRRPHRFKKQQSTMSAGGLVPQMVRRERFNASKDVDVNGNSYNLADAEIDIIEKAKSTEYNTSEIEMTSSSNELVSDSSSNVKAATGVVFDNHKTGMPNVTEDSQFGMINYTIKTDMPKVTVNPMVGKLNHTRLVGMSTKHKSEKEMVTNESRTTSPAHLGNHDKELRMGFRMRSNASSDQTVNHSAKVGGLIEQTGKRQRSFNETKTSLPSRHRYHKTDEVIPHHVPAFDKSPRFTSHRIPDSSSHRRTSRQGFWYEPFVERYRPGSARDTYIPAAYKTRRGISEVYLPVKHNALDAVDGLWVNSNKQYSTNRRSPREGTWRRWRKSPRISIKRWYDQL
ncbi:hypothetical protein PoB_006939900 [Plakobranchus ocellatus]|uniref:Sushi domain-containing protein n=1 Tax=Plakobranchus ocellatus TaxID=259542 RepID=A0AAV4DFD5_9GAST|nr:hypothetical protein PoB_006939900 [Plakobranchus ocellatus]